MNLWFEGGGWTCCWGFGVAEAFKQKNIKIDLVGAYSAGVYPAIYMLSDLDADYSFSAIQSCPHGPTKGKFSLVGRHEKNLKHISEHMLGLPTEFKIEDFNNKLWIAIQPLERKQGCWRKIYRDYDDIVDCTISTQCIPFISHGEITKCYYDDPGVGEKKGLTVDGGLFERNPPKEWKKEETVCISQWGNGDINMEPPPGIHEILFPNLNDLSLFRKRGFDQGIKYINTYIL
jgi:hypothetical protein